VIEENVISGTVVTRGEKTLKGFDLNNPGLKPGVVTPYQILPVV
jgi:hypothetical protein